MKGFLRFRSRRWGYDGWALRVRGTKIPLFHTVCTTRCEARLLKDEMTTDLFAPLDVVKVRIKVEVAE